MTNPTPFIQLPFTVPNANGVTLQSPENVTFMLPSTAELLANGHWLFGSDNASMLDLISAQAMTPVGLSPTMSTGYLTTGGNGGNGDGLASPFADSANETVCCVVQKTGTPSQAMALMGYWLSGGTTGSVVYESAAGVYDVNTEPSGVNTAVPPPSGATIGNWLWLGMSHNSTTGLRSVVWGDITGGGTQGIIATTQSVVKTPAGSFKTGIGSQNGGFGGGGTGFPGVYAEYIHFGFGMTPAQMAGVYGRSVTRLAARGITVY